MNTTGEFSPETSIPPEVRHLDQEYFPGAWKAEQWLSVNLLHHSLFTWRLNKEVVGFALLGTVPGDDVAHLHKILIAPSHQHHGHAQKFWGRICQELKNNSFSRVYLEVAALNTPAITFYEKQSFRLLRKVRGYYSNGADAWMMELTL